MSDLRTATIKLAYTNPELRKHLLPILKNARFHEGPEGEKEFREWFESQPQDFQDEWEENTEKYKDKFKTAANTFPCPTCDTKVLEQTSYCVKCKKKVKKA